MLVVWIAAGISIGSWLMWCVDEERRRSRAYRERLHELQERVRE